MNDPIRLLLSAVAGLLLGGFFFLALWWSLRKALVSTWPMLWQLGGMLARFAVVLAGFYFVADGRWQRMLACLAGFVVARIVLLRLVPSPLHRLATNEEASHAPRP